MATVITVDGVGYDILVPKNDIQRSAVISDGDNASTAKSGLDLHDTIGTYYNYTYTFIRAGDNVADYDALYEMLTDPAVRDHTIVVPYGQSTITFMASVSEINDTLKKSKNGVNYWDGFTVKFKATRPYRTP
jgi:hypothetical protein